MAREMTKEELEKIKAETVWINPDELKRRKKKNPYREATKRMIEQEKK